MVINLNETTKTFSQCPCCGSKERFCEQVSEQAKQDGFAGDKYKLAYQINSNAAGDNAKLAALPDGSMIPAYSIVTDICASCGCVYAVELKTFEVRKATAPNRPARIPPIVLPGGKLPPLPPGHNNPFTS
jgi:hypothetical protein